MTRNIYLPSSGLVNALALLLLAGGARAQVVAERGADQITAPQARQMLAALDPDARAKVLADPNGVQNLLRDALVGRAVLEAAQSQHWDQRPEVAAAAQHARDAAVAQSFLASVAAPPSAYPSEAELQAAYDRNRAQLMQPRSYRLSQVFIPATGAAQEPARRQLATVRAALGRGRTTLEAAAKQAPGAQFGALGWVPENRLQPAAKTAIAGLLEDQVSEPVCTPAGCTLLRLEATRAAGPAALDQVRVGLIRLMRQQRTQALAQAYAEKLIAQQPVRVNEIELSHLQKP